MKKNIILPFLLSVLTLTGANAQDTTNDIIWLYELDGTNAIITGASVSDGELIIPATVSTEEYPVTAIANGAFSNKRYTSVTIPEGVTNIGKQAFFNCIDMETVKIPASVTTIGDDAFASCSALQSVYCYGKNPIDINETTFTDRDIITLYVPYGCTAAYQEANIWKDFSEIIEMEPDDVVITLKGNQATFCSESDLDLSGISGLKAYIAGGFNPTTGSIILTQVDEVPAGTGLYLKGKAGSYTAKARKTKMYVTNLLVGVTEETFLYSFSGSGSDTHINFILANGDKGICFYPATNGILAAGKAYLSLPAKSIPSEANAITLEFEEKNATGISQVYMEDNDVRNGQNDVWYTLDGRRLGAMPTQKGVYIINGKKTVIK